MGKIGSDVAVETFTVWDNICSNFTLVVEILPC